MCSLWFQGLENIITNTLSLSNVEILNLNKVQSIAEAKIRICCNIIGVVFKLRVNQYTVHWKRSTELN